MSSISIGQILLNQFRVDAFVASGGMGAVYRVWDLKRNVPLAMKVLHADLAEDPSVFRRFRREANALKKLTHPNIVPFYGLYETSDFAFLLERYIDGTSLKDILRKRSSKPMLLYEAATYLKALSAALGYAHANEVVHCDVKPGNVMIDQGGNIYLTDFGVARHAESATTTLGSAGTPAYMAPEQIRGEPVSPATDVYSLGVLLFEIVTGQRPFRGDEKSTESAGPTAGERIRYGHLVLPPPDPRLLNPALSQSLSQVVLKALAKDPNKRYQSARELFIETCKAGELNPEALADRVAPPPKPVPVVVNEERKSIKDTSSWSSSTVSRSVIQPKKRLLPWMVVGAGILLIAFMILGIRLSTNSNGSKPMVVSGIFPTNTSIRLAQIIPTFTLPPDNTPIPLPTNTHLPIPTITASPTMNSDQPWGKIVFTCQIYADSTPHQICLMNADGTNWRRMTYDDNYGHYYASLSPDGQSILFAANMTGKAEIYEMDLDGRQTRLTTELGPLSAPEISPDDRFIVFAKQYDDTHQGIWVMNRDGSNPHPVYDNPPMDALDPNWSPDGSKILFAYGGGENKHYYLMNADGTDASPIQNEFVTRGRSDWSSDGISIVGYSGDPWYRELFLMNIDGSNLHQITHGWQNQNPPYGNSQGPSFSPDGKWIAFTGYPQIHDDNGCEIYIMRVDGTDIRPLTDNNYCDWQPRWGP